eukprot:snap_masked-scaffold_27-processed-gene-4.19-mRNA-1 protein AED:0.39 eAED:0.39 QI:0/-1/0/1/-1/1/1/0/283
MENEIQSQRIYSLTTNYRVYPFNIILGPKPEKSIDVFLFMIFLNFLVLTLFGAFSFSFLKLEAFPLAVVTIFFILGTTTGLILTGTTEPGVIPARSMQSSLVTKDGEKVCDKCRVVSKINHRVMHCAYCNACVAEVDHHCGITGTCIGARNKQHFFMMLNFLAVGTYYIFFTAALLGLQFFLGNEVILILSLALSGAGILIFLFMVIFWIFSWHGLLLKKTLSFGFCQIPSPFWCCVGKCIVKPTDRFVYTKWISAIEREPSCWGNCSQPKQFFFGNNSPQKV